MMPISSSSGSATNGRPPQVGRNSIYGHGFNNLDFRVTRDVPIHDGMKLQLIAESFNLLNHPTADNPNTTYGSSNFGKSTGKGGTYGADRQFQFSLRASF